MRYLQRIPLPLLSLLLIVTPMLVHALRDWFALPLPYGELVGTADPDPWLRLTLVRDWLGGGDWYSHAVARSDAPFFHSTTPWTRPLDVVIAFFAKLQPADVDLTLRLIRAALLMPILWMSLLLLGIYRAVRTLTPLPIAPLMATVLLASVPVMRNYFSPGNADHHALLAVLFIWVVGGVLRPFPSAGISLLNGLLLGLLLWVSPEGMVLIAAVFGWYGLLWIWGDSARAAPLPLLTLSTALTGLLALMAERRPEAWLTPIYDAISIVYVAILCTIAAATYLLFRLPLRSVAARAMAATGTIVLATAFILAAYPLMIHGPLAGLDPFIYSDFLPRIVEAQPLFHKQPLYIMAMLLQPLAALGFILPAWRRGNAILSRQHLLQLAYLMAVTQGLYLLQQRFYYYADPVAIVALSVFLAALMAPEHPAIRMQWPANMLASLPPHAQMKRRLPLVLPIIVLPLALILLTPSDTTNASLNIDSCQHTARQLMQGGVLTRMGNGKPLNLLIHTDLGGEALFFTPHRIVASNYHREGPGIRFVWESDKITDLNQLRAHLAARQIEALLICPVVNPPEKSVLQRLQRGELAAPSWLMRVPYALPPQDPDAPHAEGSDPVLFLIRR